VRFSLLLEELIVFFVLRKEVVVYIMCNRDQESR